MVIEVDIMEVDVKMVCVTGFVLIVTGEVTAITNVDTQKTKKMKSRAEVMSEKFCRAASS